MIDFFQWAAFTVAVLTILVTVLITWQIWKTVDTNRAINSISTIQTQFDGLRREIDILHGMHEAFVLDIFGEDNRRKGHSYMAFDYFMRSAFIFMRDLEHYNVRFMSALSSMKTSFEDLYRPLVGGNRDKERTEFLKNRNDCIINLKILSQQARGMRSYPEQAEKCINELIELLQNLHDKSDNFDEDKI